MNDRYRISTMRWATVVSLALFFMPATAWAQVLPSITLGVGEATSPEQVSTAIQILFILTILTVAPAILLMTTAFTRIVIVLSIVRQSLGTQQMPPNQVIIGLSLFLTLFVMSPVLTEMNTQALQPYMKKEITQEVALSRAATPLREFMLKQTDEKDLGLLVEISAQQAPANEDDISLMTLIPAFMLSELKKAFQMGFLIYVPFLVIDMVVASVLLSMGMMMLPPVIISLPFKLLLFVLVDGWGLIAGSLVKSFL